ncbi:MAG: DNA-processing protein DprA [Candidatus Omnitrophota bacterium]
MTSLEALVGLNMVDGIGSVRLSRLMEFFGKPENILNAPIEKLNSVSGIGDEIASRINSFDHKQLSHELALAGKLGLKIVSREDADYPVNLKVIPGAPILLYVKGKLEEIDRLSIAIVGSRRASYYGLNAAQKFGGELSVQGLTVVSGMARGIDTAAHKGALKAGGRTIAVIGSGFNYIYPEENMELAEEISRHGAVISEFSLNKPPRRENFPRRNRIISGLSLGTLVVEAARNSGAIITADFALEQGREVFALPGKVDTMSAYGTNELIKQGAKLVTCVEDILEEFGINAEINRDASISAREDICSKESVLYKLITADPLTIDELAEKSNLSIPCLSELLLQMRLKKRIRQLPGKLFVRSENAS